MTHPSATRRRPCHAAWILSILLQCVIITLANAADAALDAPTQVGEIEALEGRVFASQPGARLRALATGSAIYQQDKVITMARASTTLRFTDQTELSLGSTTSIRIDQYHYVEAASADRAPSFSFATSILAGVVRTVTGLIAKRVPRSVRFSTSVATIGVRGTHFSVEVQGTSATVILLAQAVAGASNAIEVENQFGKVDIDEAGFGTEIPDAMSPPSPPRRMQVSNNMSRLMRSVNTTRRVKIPRSPGR